MLISRSISNSHPQRDREEAERAEGPVLCRVQSIQKVLPRKVQMYLNVVALRSVERSVALQKSAPQKMFSERVRVVPVEALRAESGVGGGQPEGVAENAVAQQRAQSTSVPVQEGDRRTRRAAPLDLSATDIHILLDSILLGTRDEKYLN